MSVVVCEDEKTHLDKMRSELTEEQPNQSANRHQSNQFVEDIGQSVANALFGYTNASENQTSTNEEESNSVRPKRSAKKVQQVCVDIQFAPYIHIFIVLHVYARPYMLSSIFPHESTVGTMIELSHIHMNDI